MTATLNLSRPPTREDAGLDDALALAQQSGRPTLYSQIHPLPAIPEPTAFLAHGSQTLGGGVLWDQPQTTLSLAGAGTAMEMRCDGDDRFGAVSAACRELADRLFRDDDEVFPIVGGFAFAAGDRDTSVWRDFPDALFHVPQLVLQVAGGVPLVRVTVKIDPNSSRSEVAQRARSFVVRAHRWAQSSVPNTSFASVAGTTSIPERRAWESSVATAVALIKQGMLEKVVLAREERIVLSRLISPTATLARLRRFDADATCFAMQSGGAWFIGASPERLVRLRGGRVDVTCLAGSTGIGRSQDERRTLATRLLASAKDREEHEIVVRATIGALADVCADVRRFPATPRIAVARSVQHLETPLTARLPTAGHVLDLVERLHPTPAVGGHPRETALSLMRELEGFDRGWYAGPFGWLDLDGSGEFAVAIRSGLLRGNTASLFAGGGIVADSNPAAEFAESELKLRPMRAALGAL